MHVCGYCGDLRQGAHGHDEVETIRDRDARAAMAALVSTWRPEAHLEPIKVGGVAVAAYRLADAMQAERERQDHEGEGTP